MDNLEEIVKLQRESKKQIDKMKVDYFSNEDYLICEYVSDQLVNIDISQINYGKIVSLNELIEKSLEEIKNVGININNNVLNLLIKTPFEYVIDEKCQFGTAVSYSFDNNDFVIPDSGIITKYLVPSELYELSIYHLAHEYIHAMKDINYNEYKSCITLGEVIPLFYELMIYNPDELLKKELLKFRMFWLLNNKKDYLLFDYLYLDEWLKEWICETDNDCKCDVYEFMMTKDGCYLNSFYYAVILYNMYKETPKKILDLISRVLKHEITTLQMLELLGIYGYINGQVFEKELAGIKKILKM